MNVSSITRCVTSTALAIVGFASAAGGQAADPIANAEKVAKLVASPAQLTLQAGKTVSFKVTALDSAGQPLQVFMRYGGAPRTALTISDSTVTAIVAGRYEIVASPFGRSTGKAPPEIKIPVVVTWPTIARVQITPEPGHLFAGVTLSHSAKAVHVDGSVRPPTNIRWATSNPAVATVDRFGNVTAIKPGPATISATIDGSKGDKAYTIASSPVATVDVQLSATEVRTGDVVRVKAIARDRQGGEVKDAPITWTYAYAQDDSIKGQGGAADLRDGMFAADFAGVYSIMATSGQVSARKAVDVRPREVMKRVQVMGRGSITHVQTSDLWPFTGRDGRDYALVGTWGGDGWSYVFDITDQANLFKTDSIQLDARVINDVTVSPDARYGVLSREGASNRVNGVAILDLSTPAHPKIAARFDEDLTGGVHNMFATNDYLFAISGGDKYIIIDVKDINAPKKVGEYNHPNSRIHDVWVHDGIAYSSEWGTGVVAADVGNGKYGGTPQKPVLISTFATTTGATHEVYPYFQKSTGKVYLFLGDEIMSRRGRVWEGTNYQLAVPGGVPQTSGGFTQIVDFTDPKHPSQVARYENPEFGSHDIIVQDDVLYQAYYDGGVRIVDVSGELMATSPGSSARSRCGSRTIRRATRPTRPSC